MRKDPVQMELFDPELNIDQILNGVDAVRDDPSVWGSLLGELVDILCDFFETRKGMDPEAAMNQAQDIIVVIAHYLGGRNIYLPKGNRLKEALRDAAIYKTYDGFNHRELATSSGLSVARIYQIINKQRSLRQDKRQLKLPFTKAV